MTSHLGLPWYGYLTFWVVFIFGGVLLSLFSFLMLGENVPSTAGVLLQPWFSLGLKEATLMMHSA